MPQSSCMQFQFKYSTVQYVQYCRITKFKSKVRVYRLRKSSSRHCSSYSWTWRVNLDFYALKAAEGIMTPHYMLIPTDRGSVSYCSMERNSLDGAAGFGASDHSLILGGQAQSLSRPIS